MNEHDVDIVRDHSQGKRHRLLTGLAAGDDVQLGLTRNRLQQATDSGLFASRRRDDDDVDRPGLGKRAHCMGEQRLTSKVAERLRLARTQPIAAASGRDDGSRPHRVGTTSCLFMGTGSPTGRENTKRPFAVVSTLVTWTISSWPTNSRPRSTTTIVPSSR